MTLTTQPFDMTGNSLKADNLQVTQDSMLNTKLASPVYFCAGTGAPTFTAAKGTVYTNITGSTTATRIYVNTDGATTWTNVTTAA